jgi:DUF4097 and DUF4098 domain-containing protein YvlB
MNLSELKSRLLAAIMGFFALLSFNSCLDNNLSVVSEIRQDFSNITEIEVEGVFLDVSYEGKSGQQDVSLDALLRANSDSRFAIEFEVDGTSLIVRTVKKSGKLGNYRSEGFIRLTGPELMEVNLSAGSGTLVAGNIVGTAHRFLASSGNIQLSDIAGDDIYIYNSSGIASGVDLTGNLGVVISSGRIDLQRVDGNVEAEASSGGINLTDVNGQVNTVVSSGKIEMLRVLTIGKGHLSSGQLRATASGLGPNTNLKASSGNIFVQTGSNLRDYNFNITAGSGFVRVGDSQSSGSLVINNGSSFTVRGEVGSGKIEIVN